MGRNMGMSKEKQINQKQTDCGGLTNCAIRKKLEELSEQDFQRFASSLIPNIPSESVLGVRLPVLRKIAKQIAKADWRGYLACASDASFEEIMLQGMVIGYARTELAVIQRYIAWFIPKIDNWSVCDSFCSGLKVAKAYPEEMWDFVLSYVRSDQEYGIRFGAVMLLNYYVDEMHWKEALAALEEIRHESYYVKMAAAWAVSVFYLKFPKETEEFLENCELDVFTYNKALQKIMESKKIDDDTRRRIRAMKIS